MFAGADLEFCERGSGQTSCLRQTFDRFQTVRNKCQQVLTLLWFHANGRNKSQHCWAKKCGVRWNGAFQSSFSITLPNVAKITIKGAVRIVSCRVYILVNNKLRRQK